VTGQVPTSYEALQDSGFSHGFGRLDANRELVEWMRQYNADSSHRIKLQFYGFDSPTEMTGTDSPRQVLQFVLDYLTSIDSASGQEYHKRIDPLLGQDSDWENPAAIMDPTKSVGVSDANGIDQPEAGTLEARLTAIPGPMRFIPTHRGQGLPTSVIAALPTRSGSVKNSTYFALTPQSIADFDWLAVLDSTA
jgi:hypothetical protein